MHGVEVEDQIVHGVQVADQIMHSGSSTTSTSDTATLSRGLKRIVMGLVRTLIRPLCRGLKRIVMGLSGIMVVGLKLE